MWLFGDSFDSYTDLTTKYDDVGTSQSISTGTGRFGTACLRCTDGTGRVNKGVVPGDPAAGAFVTMALRYVPSTPGNVAFANLWYAALDRGHVVFVRNTDGSISAWLMAANELPLQVTTVVGGSLLGTTAAGLVPAGIYTSVECYVLVHPSAGVVQVRVEGALVLNLTGITTRNASAGVNTWTSWWIGHGISAGNGVVDIDDLMLYDDFDNGDGVTDFLGDKIGECVFVTGAGTTSAYTRNTGATNAECVDDAIPDDDTTYVASDTVAQTDTYAHGALTRIVDGIVCVQVGICAKKPSAGTRAIAGVVRSGGTDYPSGTDLYLSTAYQIRVDPRPLDPDTGIAWVAADVDASEIGQTTTV
jgi:hypothetical protein